MKIPIISFETSVNWRLHQVWSLVGAEKWQSFLQLWQLLKRPGDCCPNWTTLFVFVFVFVWKLNYCQNFDLLSSMYCECIQFHLQYGDSIPPLCLNSVPTRSKKMRPAFAIKRLWGDLFLRNIRDHILGRDKIICFLIMIISSVDCWPFLICRLWPTYVIAMNNLATVTDNESDIEVRKVE